MRRRVLAIVLGLAALSPFFAVDAQAAPVRYLDVMFDEVEVTEDVVYGNARNSQGEQQDLLLDLYHAGRRRGDGPAALHLGPRQRVPVRRQG